MTEFGGMGGLADRREIDADDLFEAAIIRSLGDKIRSSDEAARALWSALSNVDWSHKNGDIASYSFRAAGDMIAAIRGTGNYMDWYSCGPYATVSDEIADAMHAEGWTATPIYV